MGGSLFYCIMCKDVLFFMFYGEENAFNTFVTPQGDTLCILVTQEKCKHWAPLSVQEFVVVCRCRHITSFYTDILEMFNERLRTANHIQMCSHRIGKNAWITWKAWT